MVLFSLPRSRSKLSLFRSNFCSRRSAQLVSGSTMFLKESKQVGTKRAIVASILVLLTVFGPANLSRAQQRVAPDIVNVVALMVEFQPDSSRFTTGNGTFEGPLFGDVDSPRIDPLPHDVAYFDAHLRFLEHYINKVSDARTKVKGTVLPQIIRVSHEMGFYSPTGKNSGDDAELVKLATLVKEAWTLAAANNVKLPAGITSDNTAFVLFHAGIGRDIELLGTTLDKTPEDLPSLFFGQDALARLGAGILKVDGITVSNTLVIPRTESRLGFDFIQEKPFLVELSINGLLAASFLNYLGVPDLFNTETGESAIGPFDVMDALGIFAFGGLFPPEPSAWTKTYMGWADVTTFQDVTNQAATLRYAGDLDRNEVARVEISDSEYFLLENRHRDPENDGIRMQVWKDGVTTEVVFPNADPEFNDVTIAGFEGGVVVGVDQYDFALPGGEDEFGNPLVGGLLIWHVDENRLNTRIQTNQVNAEPTARGLDLEEADSAQDIGFSSNSGFFGPRFDLGSPFDFWFASNPVKVRTTAGREIQLYENRFAPDTHPSSHANNGSPSAASIFNISDPALDMTFSVDQRGTSTWNGSGQFIAPLPSGFADENSFIGLLPSTLPGNEGSLPVVFGKETSGEYGVWDSHSALLDGLRGVRPVTGNFGLVALKKSVFVWLDRDHNVRMADIVADGEPFLTTSNLSWFEEAGQIHVRLGVVLQAGPAIAQVIIGSNNTMTLSLEATTAPVRRIVQRSRTASSAFLQFDGAFLDELTGNQVDISFPIAAGNSANYTTMADVGISEEGWFVAFTDPSSASLRIIHESGGEFEAYFSGCVPGRAVIEDLTLDGLGDVVVGCGSQLFGFYSNAVVIGGFPFQLKGNAISEPILAVYPEQNLVFGMVQTDVGNLDGFMIGDRVGRIDGFPLSVGKSSRVAPFVWGNQIMTLSGSGTLKSWETNSSVNLSSRNSVGMDMVQVSYRSPSPGASSGVRLLARSETYNWPNPISGGKTHLRFMTTEQAQVTVTIVDAMGQFIEKFDPITTVGSIPSEIVWTTSAQSGIYIARIEARSVQGNRSDTRLIKMAIVR